MTNHQLTLTQIKSEFIDLWKESTAGYSYVEWFEAVKEILDTHFSIKQMDFFIFDSRKRSFIPLEGHQSASKGAIEIPGELVGESEFQLIEKYLVLFRSKGFKYADELILLSDDKSEQFASLLIESTEKWRAFSKSPYLIDFITIISDLVRMIEKIKFLEAREKKFRQLFNVAELFNSTMSSQVILEGIMNTIAEAFPTFEVNLLLSHDQKELTHDYKLFDYMNERPSTIDAFVSGEVVIEDTLDVVPTKIINAPIKGRQGIYGVLQMKAPSDYLVSPTQSNFVRMLANTAGSALENASLYDQSHRLVEDLQLVNETSRKLNSNIQFDEMISYLKQQLAKALRSDEMAFVLYDENGRCEVLEASTKFFRTNEGEDYIQFVSAGLKSGKESLFDANFSVTMKKPVSYEAIIAVPITNQEEIVGFIICVNQASYSFSFDSFKLIRLLIGHSSLALANSMLRDQLQELVDKDHLTKLYARRYLDNIVEQSIEKNDGGTLILFDIDDFKLVNDTYGHSVGDHVLKQFSSFLLAEVKGKGIAARWGGEEFAVYLHWTSNDEAVRFAERIVQNIPVITDPEVTVSAGMVSWSVDQDTRLRDLFQNTDLALYKAKNKGKNQVVIHGTPLSHSK